MKSDKKYIELILSSWEQAFHKGQLTFWILISLKESPKSLGDIISFITSYTNNVINYDEQSIYRALRKYYDVELVDFEMVDSERGPQRKYYSLTPIGKSILEKFVNRNISIFQSKMVINILNKSYE